MSSNTLRAVRRYQRLGAFKYTDAMADLRDAPLPHHGSVLVRGPRHSGCSSTLEFLAAMEMAAGRRVCFVGMGEWFVHPLMRHAAAYPDTRRLLVVEDVAEGDRYWLDANLYPDAPVLVIDNLDGVESLLDPGDRDTLSRLLADDRVRILAATHDTERDHFDFEHRIEMGSGGGGVFDTGSPRPLGAGEALWWHGTGMRRVRVPWREMAPMWPLDDKRVQQVTVVGSGDEQRRAIQRVLDTMPRTEVLHLQPRGRWDEQQASTAMAALEHLGKGSTVVVERLDELATLRPGVVQELAREELWSVAGTSTMLAVSGPCLMSDHAGPGCAIWFPTGLSGERMTVRLW